MAAGTAVGAGGDSIQAHLRNVPLFSVLGDAELAPLAKQARRRRYKPGQAVFREGDVGETLYIIVSGQVSIEKLGPSSETVHIAQRGPGEHFGELALLDDQPRSADAVTATECELLMLDRPMLKSILERNPAIAWVLIRSLAARLREAAQQSVRNETQDVLGRLAEFLLEEADKVPAGPGGERRLPRLTNDTVAQRIGTTRESVSRKYRDLIDVGAMRRDGHGVVVTNRAKLRALCGG
jgi:CRP/FNR family cyclic AMP-dependent transcriptional regulator